MVAALAEVELPRHVLLLLNKVDLREERGALSSTVPIVETSARTGEGLRDLIRALEQMAGFDAGEASAFTARARHLEALADADAAFAAGLETLVATGAGDLVAEDLRRGHDALGLIVGAMTPDDLLGEIFSSFCIGK